MKFLAVFFILFAALMRPDIAAAKTLEIKSENFIITGDMRQKDGEALLRDLEIFRKNVFKVLGVNGAPEIVPVKVYVTKSDKAFKRVTGIGAIGGIYTMTHNGPAFVLNGKNGFRRGGNARHIALHEYSHHIVSAYTKMDYPLWYSEGFANYLATFTYKDGVFRVGDPYDPYARVLRQKNWMPMTIVLSTMDKYPFNLGDTSKIGAQTTSQFYAQTWLAIHYLRNTKKHKDALSTYIDLINKKSDSLDAFKVATGLTPEEFEVELKAYFKANKYNVTRFKTTDTDVPEAVTRALTKQEAEIVRLTAMRDFTFTPERRDVVIKAYEAYEAKFGISAQSLTGKADLLAYNAKTKEAYTKARDMIEAALSLEPDNIETNATAAMILIHQNGSRLGGEAGDMKRARKYAAKVLKQDRQVPLANYSYALSYRGESNPPENALNAAAYAIDYYRAKGFIGSNLTLAGILLNGEKYDEAMPPITRAITWSDDMGMRMAAQGMRKHIRAETKK